MINWTEAEDSIRSDIFEWLECSGRSMTSDSSDVENLLSHIRKVLEQ